MDTEYLVEHRNFTGYEQVLRETTTNATGYVVREVVYTLGHDVVSQWSSGGIHTYTDPVDENDPNPGRELYAPSGSFLFLYDGHGSVRSILPRGYYWVVSAWKAFTYDAYGNALGFNPTYAGTSILYSGEQYDARIQQQYLRARFYDPKTGRFNRLDPFVGNMQDPQSLHKYLYVHGDPTNMTDPTGLFGLGGMVAAIGISFGNVSTELVTGALIITILETGGKAGFDARMAGMILVAQGEFDLGFRLYNLGSRILALALNVIETVETAIGLGQIAGALAMGGISLARNLPDMADTVMNMARRVASKISRRSSRLFGHAEYVVDNAARASEMRKFVTLQPSEVDLGENGE